MDRDDSVDVITTINGGAEPSQTVAESGALLGYESGNDRPPQDLPVEFVDWPFSKTDVSFADHLEAVRRESPRYAVAPDVESEDELEASIEQADRLAEYADVVIMVPKAVHPTEIPDRFRVGLPLANFGKATEDVDEFVDTSGTPQFHQWTDYRDVDSVHILGGSPTIQREVVKYGVPVDSLDGASVFKGAQMGNIWAPSRERHWHPAHPDRFGFYDRLRASLDNIVEAWHAGVDYTIPEDRADVVEAKGRAARDVEAAREDVVANRGEDVDELTEEERRYRQARGPPIIDENEADLWAPDDNVPGEHWDYSEELEGREEQALEAIKEDRREGTRGTNLEAFATDDGADETPAIPDGGESPDETDDADRDEAPRMYWVKGPQGPQDWLDGQDVLVSAGVAWRNPGDGFSTDVPDAERLFVDSGGYQAAVHFQDEYPYSAEELLEWAEEIGADYLAGMDWACEDADQLAALYDDVDPDDIAPVEERLERTIVDQAEQLEAYEAGDWSFELVPVVQGLTTDQYRYCARRLREENLAATYMGIGTVCKRETADGILEVLDVCEEELPATDWHLFGATKQVWTDRRFWGRFRSADTHAWAMKTPEDEWTQDDEDKKRAFRAYRDDIEAEREKMAGQSTFSSSNASRALASSLIAVGARRCVCGTCIPAYATDFEPGCRHCETTAINRFDAALADVEEAQRDMTDDDSNPYDPTEEFGAGGQRTLGGGPEGGQSRIADVDDDGESEIESTDEVNPGGLEADERDLEDDPDDAEQAALDVGAGARRDPDEAGLDDFAGDGGVYDPTEEDGSDDWEDAFNVQDGSIPDYVGDWDRVEKARWLAYELDNPNATRGADDPREFRVAVETSRASDDRYFVMLEDLEAESDSTIGKPHYKDVENAKDVLTEWIKEHPAAEDVRDSADSPPRPEDHGIRHLTPEQQAERFGADGWAPHKVRYVTDDRFTGATSKAIADATWGPGDLIRLHEDNTAEELEELPGIGEGTRKKIGKVVPKLEAAGYSRNDTRAARSELETDALVDDRPKAGEWAVVRWTVDGQDGPTATHGEVVNAGHSTFEVKVNPDEAGSTYVDLADGRVEETKGDGTTFSEGDLIELDVKEDVGDDIHEGRKIDGPADDPDDVQDDADDGPGLDGYDDAQEELRAKHPELTINVYETDDHLTLEKIIVPEDQRGEGKGTAFMEDLAEYADETGKTVRLTPSEDYGASSRGRLIDFYSRFGFVENEGENRDYQISEGMYRLPADDGADDVDDELDVTLLPGEPEDDVQDVTIPREVNGWEYDDDAPLHGALTWANPENADEYVGYDQSGGHSWSAWLDGPDRNRRDTYESFGDPEAAIDHAVELMERHEPTAPIDDDLPDDWGPKGYEDVPPEERDRLIESHRGDVLDQREIPESGLSASDLTDWPYINRESGPSEDEREHFNEIMSGIYDPTEEEQSPSTESAAPFDPTELFEDDVAEEFDAEVEWQDVEHPENVPEGEKETEIDLAERILRAGGNRTGFGHHEEVRRSMGEWREEYAGTEDDPGYWERMTYELTPRERNMGTLEGDLEERYKKARTVIAWASDEIDHDVLRELEREQSQEATDAWKENAEDVASEKAARELFVDDPPEQYEGWERIDVSNPDELVTYYGVENGHEKAVIAYETDDGGDVKEVLLEELDEDVSVEEVPANRYPPYDGNWYEDLKEHLDTFGKHLDDDWLEGADDVETADDVDDQEPSVAVEWDTLEDADQFRADYPGILHDDDNRSRKTTVLEADLSDSIVEQIAHRIVEGEEHVETERVMDEMMGRDTDDDQDDDVDEEPELEDAETEDVDESPIGDPIEVEFAKRQYANEFRDGNEELLHGNDNRSMKTVRLDPSIDDEAVEKAEDEAFKSRSDETKSYGQSKLSDGEREQLQERDGWTWGSNGFEAQSAKAALLAEGATDWMNYYEAGMDQSAALELFDQGKQAAAQGRGPTAAGDVVDSDPDPGEMARQAEQVEAEQCGAARDAAEDGDLEAIDFLLQHCDWSEDEVAELEDAFAAIGEEPDTVLGAVYDPTQDTGEDLGASFDEWAAEAAPEPPEEPSDEELRQLAPDPADDPPEELPPEALRALKKAWSGYKLAREEQREAVARADHFASIINGIRAVNGQDPLEFDGLEGFEGGKPLPDDGSEEFPTDDGQMTLDEAEEKGRISGAVQTGLNRYVGECYDPCEEFDG